MEFKRHQWYRTTEEVTARGKDSWLTLPPGVNLIFLRVSRNSLGIPYYYHFQLSNFGEVRMNGAGIQTLIQL